MIKLVLSDVDGTLLPFGDQTVAERTRRAIASVRDHGVRFGLATGRDRTQLLRIFSGDDVALSCGLYSNGKEVVVDGKLRHLTLLDRSGLLRLVELVRDVEQTYVCIFPLETDPSNPVFCIGGAEKDVYELSEAFSFTPTIVDAVPEVEVISATIACLQDQPFLDDLKRRAAVCCPEFDFAQPAPHWCDVIPRGLNKGTALPLLLDELGLSSDEVVFFGDAENDLGLLRACEHSVAVANATPAAAAAARHHIADAATDAVAASLEELVAALEAGESWPLLYRD